MDYLRNLGSAAASTLLQKSGIALPFSLGEKVIYFDGKSIWSLYDAVKRDDSSQVSVFMFDAGQPNKRSQLPLAKNALRKLRSIRHPDVLKFVEVVETDTTIYIVTERIQPVMKVLNSSLHGKDDWLVWGLHRIATALAFVNDSCASTHGNVRVDSIFVSSSGEWRLGGFEVLSSAQDDAAVLYSMCGLLPDASVYASPEVAKAGWSVLKELPPHVQDAYSLGLLIYSLFNSTLPLPSNSATTPPPRGSIPSVLYAPFKRLLNPSTKARLTPQAFLDLGMAPSGFFNENRLVRICNGLTGFALAGEGEKNELLRTLKDSSDSLPSNFISYLVLPSLLAALQHAGATASALLPLILQAASKVPPSDYNTLVLTPLVKLFASSDRGTRMALLDHLSEFADKLDEKIVVADVWPHLQTGFTDTVAVIREATVRSIILIAPKLSARILNNDLLRHLARAQSDPEPSIRTNTAILLGRLAPSLSLVSRRKVLVPAFSRATKDSFVHARVAGLMAFMACGELFEPQDIARGVLPVIVGALIDGHKLVRDQAFKTMEYFVKRLEDHALTMPETDQPVDNANRGAGQPTPGNLASSAAGAAGALAGWAISSLGKKLTSGELQTEIGGAVEKSKSTAPSTSTTTNGGHLAPSASRQPMSFLSAPGTPQVSIGKTKAMQLGASRVSTTGASSMDSLAAGWADELGGEVGSSTAWGGDLIDLDADTEDWSAFETAPTSTQQSSYFTGSTARTSSNGKAVEADAYDSWGDSLDPPLSAIPANKAPAKPSFGQTLSPRPVAITSHPASEHGWDTLGNTRDQGHKLPAVSGMAGSSKDRAAEMARKKEERKQRIAHLKEQKNKVFGANA